MPQIVIGCVAKETAAQAWMVGKKIVEKIRGGRKVSIFNETTTAGDYASTSHEGTAPVSLHDAPPNARI